MKVIGNISGIFSWDGWFYASKHGKNKNRYYRSQNVRFDDSCGVTEEITIDEYMLSAKKYKEVME